MLLDLKQLFLERQLSLRGVIHVGAHHGQELSLYVQMGAQEIALFEPLASNINILATNVAALQLTSSVPRVDFYQLALGSTHQQSNMTLASNQGQSSSLLKPKQHLQRHPNVTFEGSETVCVTRMDRIITQPHRYNLLCIDVQGYELEVLKGAGEFILKHIDAICCEVNRAEVYEGNAMVGEIDRYLETFQFTRLTTVWSGDIWGDALYVRNCDRSMVPRVASLAQQESTWLMQFSHKHKIDLSLATGRRLIAGINMQDRCYISWEPGLTKKPDIKQLDALHLIRMGRFSNNIIQLLHGCVLARRLGISRIVVPSDFAHLGDVNTSIHDLHIIQEDLPDATAGLRLLSHCWFPGGAMQPLFRDITIREVRQAADRLIRPLFYHYAPLRCSHDTGAATGKRLVVHIRSGDLFRSDTKQETIRRPHPFYMQPPFAFYQTAIEHSLAHAEGHTQIQLVIEDDKNPVGGVLLQWLQQRKLAVQVVTGDFMDALDAMLAAHSLVSSYGSVVEMVGLLSGQLQVIYTFRGYGRWAERPYGGHGRYERLSSAHTLIEIQGSQPYIEPGTWADSEQQRKLMLNYVISPQDLTARPIPESSDAEQPFFMTQAC